MLRLLLRFLVLVVAIAIVRSVVASVARLFSQAMRTQASPPSHPPAASPGGELKQDPVCGTFVPMSTAVKKTVDGQLVHFCSVACRDKFKVA